MTKPGDRLLALVTAPMEKGSTTMHLVVNCVMEVEGVEYVGFEGVSKAGLGPMWPRWYFYPREGVALANPSDDEITKPD